ncbi:glycosyltransferase family 1 protein [Fibrella forsythiae]|uniref:Glycosyltransferase family 1 protein n=1 Tax=Fibrella forsythiae TaxID=2817061 RepID=A0ABS3JS61_9BACT|nr:glycosyltransferase family 1 protein [Fibrella forsythiae]MBO0952216.1 glycosyltransferase family 1 protein [Fibrella forsythiae]
MKLSDYSTSSSGASTTENLSNSTAVNTFSNTTELNKVAKLGRATDALSNEAELPEHLLCFSHLRWNFVYQRPQHLMSRASQQMTVWFLEEPIWGHDLRVEVRSEGDNLKVVVPHIPHGTPHQEVIAYQRRMVDQLIESERIANYVAWYYTPMALLFSDHLTPTRTVYDCMDELSAFLGAPRELLDQETRLMGLADQVFTGGYSLYEAKRTRHAHAHAFPSSIDFTHFSKARSRQTDPADQAQIPQPRIGFSGVIDERFDVDLLRDLAQSRPDWQFVIIGPIVKINPATLPHTPNVHYLGMKSYKDLPTYFSGWDVAMLPFALNESTKFISPTKTPEYLAAGLPTVSTPIRDVVRTYGEKGFTQIASTAAEFEAAIEKALKHEHPKSWEAVDQFLNENSWDKTWQDMSNCISEVKS